MGSAYIYHREMDGNWTFVQKIYNSDQDDYDRFGWSVAIDGDLIVVGAYREDHNVMDGGLLSNAGSAYIFERNDAGVWNQIKKLSHLTERKKMNLDFLLLFTKKSLLLAHLIIRQMVVVQIIAIMLVRPMYLNENWMVLGLNRPK